MNEGVVQRLWTSGNLEKPCCLCERRWAETWRLEQVLAGLKWAVRLAFGYNGVRHARRYTRHVAQRLSRRDVDIYTCEIDTRDHHAVERGRQGALVDIVLVETDSDRFWVNFDEFGQRVL